MKVNLGTGAQNSHDWDRVLAGDFSSPPADARTGSASRARSPSVISPNRSASTASGSPSTAARHTA